MEFFCSEEWVNPFGKMRFMGLAYREKKFLFSLKSR